MGQSLSIEELLHRNQSLEKQISTLKSAEKINYTLFDISNAVNMTHNLEALYQAIYNSLNKLKPLPNFFIAIYDNKNETINFEFFVDEYDDDFPIIENLKEPNCLTGEVIHSKRPSLFKENMLLEKAKQNKLVGTIPRIWLGVPLIIRDTVIGVISAQSYTDPDYFSHKHLEMFVSVSEQIAIAIERKQVIDDLEKKERTLSLITDNTSSIVIIIDSHGNYEFTNPAHHKLGYNPDDLKNQSFFDLVHHSDIQKLMHFLERGISGSTSHITLDFKFLDKSHQYHNLEGTFDIIRDQDGFIEKIIFIGEDISEKKEAQKALLESQERFRLIFDTNPDSILITNIESGAIFDANKAFLSLSGFRKTDIIGKTTNEIGIWKNGKQRSAYISKLKQNGRYENLETTLFLNNRTISTLISSSLLQLNDATHIILIIRDISDRKSLEKQLQQRQKMDSITTLAGGIAHDFNNLLSSIMGYLELLNLDHETLSSTQRESVTNALISSKRAAKLIRQLQGLTKPDSGTRSSFDIYKVITDVFDMIGQTATPLIDLKNVVLKDQFYVQGFDNELHQALLNLGMNAVEAIEEKGTSPGSYIKFYAVNDPLPKQRLSALPDKEYHHFCFEDSGCGMRNDVREKAFDPMFSTKAMSDKKGQGLGLTMVFYIITTKHGGIIDFETKPGVGTTFHLYLPAARKPNPDEKKPIAELKNTRTVLVIEDEDMVRDMAVKALTSFGYNTLEASDGEMGLDIFKKNYKSIDAILLDVIMPKMSGTETFRQMLALDPDIKVIIASGHITNMDQKKIFAKASAYLDKPYQIMELKQVLNTILK